MSLVPKEWMPSAKIVRIILHWTAGGHKASEFDRGHYHLLIENDGKVIKGIPSIAMNGLPKAKAGYAAHTRNCNTGSIGVSMCCMGGSDVKERPFNPGKYPLTKIQWEVAAHAVRELCLNYNILVTPKTVLSHAEVQNNLAIAQRGKWDVARLPWDPAFDTARECGDLFRKMVSDGPTA